MVMTLLLPITRLQAALEANSQNVDGQTEHWPVVRLYTPLGKSVWLLSQIEPNDRDKAFGLCDEGNGQPTLEHVSLSELTARFGHLSVRWDDKFQADKPLSAYAEAARKSGHIEH